MFSQLTLISLLHLTIAFQAPADAIQKHYKTAQDLQNAGKSEAAKHEYQEALGEGYHNLGKVFLAVGEYQKAVKAFDRALANGSPTDANLLHLATALFYTQQYDKAIVQLKRLLAHDAKNLAAHHLLGKTYFMQRQFDPSVSELETAFKLAPSDFDIGYTLALAHLKKKDPTTARLIFNRLVTAKGNTPEVHILIGRAYRETEYLDEAIAEFKKTIALNPKHPGAHYCLGLSYLLKDGTLKLKEAAAEFRSELASYPEEFLAIYNLGVVCVIERQYEEGAIWLEKAARLRPQNPEVFLFLGNAYHGLSRFDKAVEAFERCLRLNPDLDKTSAQAPEAHFLFGKSLVRIGRTEDGEKHLQIAKELKAQSLSSDREKTEAYMKSEPYKGMQRGQGEQDLFATVINVSDPKLKEKMQGTERMYTQAVAIIHNQIGLLEAERQNFRAAMLEFYAASEWDSNLRDINYNLGLAAYRAEQYREAIPALEAELNTNSTNVPAKHLLGMCYFMADEYAKSAELLRQVIPQKPNNVALFYTYSLALLKQNKVEEANEIIKQMMTSGGDSPQIHILLSQAQYAQNDDTNALAELQKALAMDNKVPMAHFYAGMIYVKAGKFPEAAKEFEAELAINPKDPQAKYHLGFIHLTSGQTDRGMKLMREVIASNPDFADARFELGKALLQQGEVAGAIENLEAGVKSGPEKPHIYYQLSRAYTAAGREAEARKALEQYQHLKEKERNRTNP
jgi:tetratricopeptide (TPR) repeat protein